MGRAVRRCAPNLFFLSCLFLLRVPVLSRFLCKSLSDSRFSGPFVVITPTPLCPSPRLSYLPMPPSRKRFVLLETGVAGNLALSTLSRTPHDVVPGSPHSQTIWDPCLMLLLTQRRKCFLIFRVLIFVHALFRPSFHAVRRGV